MPRWMLEIFLRILMALSISMLATFPVAALVWLVFLATEWTVPDRAAAWGIGTFYVLFGLWIFWRSGGRKHPTRSLGRKTSGHLTKMERKPLQSSALDTRPRF